MVELLRVNILDSEWVEELLTKGLQLQEIKEGETMRISDILCVLGALPVL